MIATRIRIRIRMRMRMALFARDVAGLAALGLMLFCTSPAVYAKPKCTISATAVNFGAYNVFAAAPDDNGVGTVQVNCNGAGKTVSVTMDTGLGGSYTPRVMRYGANTLSYNLYSDAARRAIWGDGSGGSSAVGVGGKVNTTLDVFGRIPAGQNVSVGAYSDSITVTVTF